MASEKTERKDIGSLVVDTHTWIKRRFDNEAKRYLQMYAHIFDGILPERFLQTDRVDINIVYPIVKTLIPNLYFRDPKVFGKSLVKKIVAPAVDENNQPIKGEGGAPILTEYDGPATAKIFASQINKNIHDAKLKIEVKDAILDAHLMFFGAIKSGWNHEQGVASMTDGKPPPSVFEGVNEDMCYGLRFKPWNVVVDMENFYHPEWIALRHIVKIEQLQEDSRLKNTDLIEGTSKVDDFASQGLFREIYKNEKQKWIEYFEVYYKPSAKYPKGKFFIFSPEIKDVFLYEDEWPTESTDFPIRLLYFNRDPSGGLPIPDVRYYAGQQKAKLNIRNAQYEFVLRTMPIIGVNKSGVKNAESVIAAITSGQIPRAVETNIPVQKAIGTVSYPNLNPEFHVFDGTIDQDVTRMTGFVKGTSLPSGDKGFRFAEGIKEASAAEQIRNSERSDIVSDFLLSIVEYWAQLYQEFAAPENYTTVDDEEFPVVWSKEQINGQFVFRLKPFSMNFEDPQVLRRQWQDLLNILAAPPVAAGLGQQGADVDYVKIVSRILESFQEPDVENFIRREGRKPQDQVRRALEENQLLKIGEGEQVQVQPGDNHNIHILIHQAEQEVTLEHIQAHSEALEQIFEQQGGGGNKEGQPTNGVAVNQEQFRQPLKPSATNQKTAINRENTR